MSLTPHQALSIVVLIYYVPSLVPTSFLLHRHSLGKSWGWLYLFIFAIFRVVGASLQIASGFNESTGLRTAASMLASVGVMTLLLAMLELVMNVKTTLGSSDPIPPRVWLLLHLSQWTAFILSIIYITAGGQNLNRAATVIVTCFFAAQAIISLVFYLRLRSANSSVEPRKEQQAEEEKDESVQDHRITMRLLHILFVSAPFLAVRVVYMILSTFKRDSIFPEDLNDGEGSDRSALPDVYIAAFMQYLMESIVFALFICAGFIMPSLRKRKQQEKEMNSEENGSQVELRARERGESV
ncbi:hypothetical protein BJY04DRAFT_429 [Aspergillus karnatakaensis]|uniref:uncharacterized protein n=1 Tax=Aspergillus karnatakaensis TaxID=1810916 RepID=UPI003CCCB0C3